MSALTRRDAIATAAALTAGAALPAASQAASVQPAHRSPMTPDALKRFGQRLREARAAKPEWFTLEQIARNCGTTPEEILAWEAGEREPSASQFFELSVHYLLHQEWFFSEVGTRDTDPKREDQYQDIAQQIREAREAAGLSVYKVAQMLEVPISYWEEIEAGTRPLDFALGVRACTLFDVDCDDIVRPDA